MISNTQNNNPSSRYGNLIAVLGSMTIAQKAQRALADAAIRSDIVKSEASSQHGCVYGVRFAANQITNVRMILTGAHVNIRRFEEDGGGFIWA